MTSFPVSPGVVVREIDNTTTAAGVATSTGAFVGQFRWGPTDEIVTITSEKELAAVFGAPNDATTATHFLTAGSFLAYSNDLRVIRVAEATAAASAGTIADAKYVGTMGDSLRVEICPADAAAFAAWTHADLFDTIPGTSAFAEARSCSADEVHIVVIDEDGLFSGTPGTVLETFAYASQASDAKDGNKSIYYVDVLNNSSNYVVWADHPAELTDAGDDTATVDSAYTVVTAALTDSLASGADGVAVDNGEIEAGLELLEDDSIEVNFIFTVPGGGEANAQSQANKMITIAESRSDAVAFISPLVSLTEDIASSQAASLVSYFTDINPSSYAVFDSTALKVYDRYNDTFRAIPACGHIAGLCAYTDQVANPWFSPAGTERGRLRNVTKIYYNPKKTDRDTLYKNRINPIITLSGAGTILFGDKTALSRPSAFDRINVRRLFITLEKQIQEYAQAQLFQQNDEFTRAQFRSVVDGLLRSVQGGRGISEYLVVCDESNNTPTIVSSNQFVADIYIKPTYSINFITLNFVAVGADVTFSEVVGQ